MKALVIGYGSIGKRHSQILKDLLGENSVDGVTRQNIGSAGFYSDLSSVPDLNAYDFFVVASETYRHYEHLKLIESRVKNKTILVEKPLFDREQNITISNNYVYVAYNLRFHPIIQAIREWIQVQKPISVNVLTGQYLPAWRPGTDYRKCYSSFKEKGGGVLLDLSHEIDYIQWLFGNIISLSSIEGKVSDLEITSDDMAMAIGRTDRGVLFNFSIDYISKMSIRRILVHSNNQTLFGDLVENKLSVYSTDGHQVRIQNYPLDRNYTYIQMHQALIQKKDADLCKLSEGLNVMRVITEIRRNSEGWQSDEY